MGTCEQCQTEIARIGSAFAPGKPLKIEGEPFCLPSSQDVTMNK